MANGNEHGSATTGKCRYRGRFAQLTTQLKKRKPDLDLRVWPEYGKPEEIEIVLGWWPPLGTMQRFPNLKLIMLFCTDTW